MSLQGSLKHLQLADVIQLISVSGKTGMFHLKKDEHVGLIYLKDGNIIHAELDEIKGEEAVYELAIWNDGEFNFEPDVEPKVKTVSKSNTNLLMEAARRLDEWRVLSRKIPNLEMIPEFIVDQESDRGQIQLNTHEWLILSKITGKSDIRSIAKASNLPVFDICKVLYGLVTHGLVALKEAPEPSSVPAAPVSTSSSGVSKENLLSLLEKIKNICNNTLGKQAEAVVDKQYQKAKSDIEHGAGMGAIQEAVTQIAKASQILKGPITTEVLLDQLKTLKL
ncbi:DUF4388 domain-containing protein [bacterium]|nr:DUF4388 domain-containing protein [bacterium]MCI0602854.1 DUF4388 domain-containing protein [bacterium]